MSEASKIWKVIKRSNSSEWQRIENRTQNHVPDCIVLAPDGRVSWVEGKYVKGWPARASTATDLGLQKGQVNFLKRWCRLGGRAWLLVRVNDDFLLIHGSQLEYELTQVGWFKRCTKIWRGKLDVKELEGII